METKLIRLRKNGWANYTRVLGEYVDHRFLLDPPYPEKDVRSFETGFGITLPSQFRTFITTLGSSGAGPHYGLLSKDWYTSTDLFEDPLKTARSFQDPCPLEEKKYGDDWLEEIGGDDWEKRLYEDQSWNPLQGMISISSLGCAGSGPLRGRLFWINLDLWPPGIYEQTSFFDWYEAWLDALLEGKDNNAMGVWDGHP
jgi:hypothetical protein